jgi:hypothetical protein
MAGQNGRESAKDIRILTRGTAKMSTAGTGVWIVTRKQSTEIRILIYRILSNALPSFGRFFG